MREHGVNATTAVYAIQCRVSLSNGKHKEEEMKRTLGTVVMILSALVLVTSAQKRDELRERYGAPDDHQRYTVRPDIGMTVELGEDGQAARMVIKPLNPDDPSNSHDHGSVMPSETANDIVKEVSPVATRGLRKHHAGFASGCTSGQIEEYEHIEINTVTRCEQQGGGVYSVTLTRR